MGWLTARIRRWRRRGLVSRADRVQRRMIGAMVIDAHARRVQRLAAREELEPEEDPEDDGTNLRTLAHCSAALSNSASNPPTHSPPSTPPGVPCIAGVIAGGYASVNHLGLDAWSTRTSSNGTRASARTRHNRIQYVQYGMRGPSGE